MADLESLKAQIQTAFADVQYPGDECLVSSSYGDEPDLLEQEFKGKSDWRQLDPQFLDQAPDGYGSALSFFSDEAFRFYLPAYLLSDIDGLLGQATPVFHLTYGLRNSSKHEHVNPRLYGDRTWFEYFSDRLAAINKMQAAAVVAYLRFKREAENFHLQAIDEALKNFWLSKAG